MAHQDKGHYAAKHPEETQIDERIAGLIREKARDQVITCADATSIAEVTGKTMEEVGINLDLQEMRISFCQMGLFGFSPDKRIVKAAEKVDSILQTAIEEKLHDGRLSCENSWKIADQLNLPRMSVSEACEALKIKIKPCQLGAF
jgi:DNA polymerase elongation subunit (family B)